MTAPAPRKARHDPKRTRLASDCRVFLSPVLAAEREQARALGEGYAERLTVIASRYAVLWPDHVPRLAATQWRSLERALAGVAISDHAATLPTPADVAHWLDLAGCDKLSRLVAQMKPGEIVAMLEESRRRSLSSAQPVKSGHQQTNPR